jgi:hypothetical protein
MALRAKHGEQQDEIEPVDGGWLTGFESLLHLPGRSAVLKRRGPSNSLFHVYMCIASLARRFSKAEEKYITFQPRTYQACPLS